MSYLYGSRFVELQLKKMKEENLPKDEAQRRTAEEMRVQNVKLEPKSEYVYAVRNLQVLKFKDFCCLFYCHSVFANLFMVLNHATSK